MKLTLRDKSTLYHELAKLVKSGFGIEKSADLLLQQAPNRAQGTFARTIQERLESGTSIAQAIDQPTLGVGPLDVSIIDATERGGVLEEGFEYLREHYASVLQTGKAVQVRLIYPGILLHLAAFLPILPSLILGDPVRGKLFAALGTLLIAYVVVAGSIGIWNLLARAAANSVSADRLLHGVPLLGRARRLKALHRFANVLRIYLLSSHRVSEGLEAAGRASQSAILNQAAQTLSQHAAAGGALGELLLKQSALPRDLARSLSSAELAGNLEEDLRSWGESYRQSVHQQMTRLGVVLPMLLTALVAIYVAWRIISLYAGLFNERMKELEQFW